MHLQSTNGSPMRSICGCTRPPRLSHCLTTVLLFLQRTVGVLQQNLLRQHWQWLLMCACMQSAECQAGGSCTPAANPNVQSTRVHMPLDHVQPATTATVLI